MAGARDVRAGGAFVELSTKNSLQKGLSAAQRMMRSFGTNLTLLGGAMTAATGGMAASLVPMLMNFISVGDNLDKMSGRTNVAVEKLSALTYAFEQNGASQQDLEKALTATNGLMADLQRKGERSRSIMNRLGLSFSDVANSSPDEAMILLSDRISMVTDPAQKSAMAMEVFGESGKQMLNFINQGASGIESLTERADDLGLVMSGDSAKSAATLGDRISELKQSFIGIGMQIMGALAPTFVMIGEKIAEVAKFVMVFIKQNKDMIITIGQVMLILLAVGAAIFAVGLAITAVGTIIGAMVAIASAIAAAFGAVVAVLAFILSPIGLVIVAVLGIAAAVLYFTGAGGKALTWFGEKWTELLDFVMPVVQGIKDALSAGDLVLAGKILWSGLELAWLSGTRKLREIWVGFRVAMLNVFDGLITSLRQAWNSAIGWIAEKLLYLYSLVDRSFDYASAAAQLAKDTSSKNNALQRAADARADDRYEAGAEQIALVESRIKELRTTLDSQLSEASEKAAIAAEERAKAMNNPDNQPAVDTMRNIQSGGTFSGFAAGMMGGSVSAIDRLAEKQDTANTLLDGIKEGVEKFIGNTFS